MKGRMKPMYAMYDVEELNASVSTHGFEGSA